MIVLVTGGREYEDRAMVSKALRAVGFRAGDTLVCGGAKGLDTLARLEAEKTRGANVRVFLARWKELGRQAGPVRNRRMLRTLLRERAPFFVLAFPGGRGTADMVRQARKAGVLVLSVT